MGMGGESGRGIAVLCLKGQWERRSGEGGPGAPAAPSSATLRLRVQLSRQLLSQALVTGQFSRCVPCLDLAF